MNIKSRITSILNTPCLENTITQFPSFDLADLNLSSEHFLDLPTNLRLGHLAEKVVSQLIKQSSNYKVLFENIQLIENKNTLGELDFVLENIETSQLTHLELAYKFYLYDPSISNIQNHNWIGPNRKDSLQEKLTKLKNKQFPLLQHPVAKSKMEGIDFNKINQALCFLITLFIPYDFKEKLDPSLNSAIKGYYINYQLFKELNTSNKLYHIPTKLEWGMNPAENDEWTEFDGIKNFVKERLDEKQSVLCWQRSGTSFNSVVVTFW